jgi:hypothetical protein
VLKDKVFAAEDLRAAFKAGLDRGVFVASVLMRSPIEGEYPSEMEYLAMVTKPKVGLGLDAYTETRGVSRPA